MAAKKNKHWTRREALRALSTCAVSGLVGMSGMLHGCQPRSGGVQKTPKGKGSAASADDPKFLIVIGAMGGASIIDSFMALRQSDCDEADYPKINAFPDEQVLDVGRFSAVDIPASAGFNLLGNTVDTSQSAFVNKHKEDMMVVSLEGTSVNHSVAQYRSITGGGSAWSGRTLQEVAAQTYGQNCLLPNVNMAGNGFFQNGTDDSLASSAQAIPVSNPVVWPLGLDGSKGILDLPESQWIQMARALRKEKLEPSSDFMKTFGKSPLLQRWWSHRDTVQGQVEAGDLISKLMFLSNDDLPLNDFGLSSSPDANLLRDVFPDSILDPFEAQAALAFLLLKNRISVTTTIGVTFDSVVTGNITNPPLAFDYSHNSHRATQAIMWERILGVCDRLIDLLKAEEYDPSTGESFWDRTMIYVATDFGRSKGRLGAAEDFGTGHDLNNGALIISPMAKGNTVLGGVDPTTALTYGFNPTTGIPDPARKTTETELFAGLVQALGVDTSGTGLPDMPAMRKTT